MKRLRRPPRSEGGALVQADGDNPAADGVESLRSVERKDGSPTGQEAGVTVTQLLRALAGLGWLIWGLYIYWSTFFVPGAAEVGLLFTAAGMAVLCLAFTPWRWLSDRRFDILLLVGTLVAVAVWVYTAVYASPGYGTDEIAFQQGAAQVLLHGTNPYGANLSWALNAFNVPPAYQTQTLAGGLVHQLDYPALSFLVYVPFLWAGMQAQAAVYVDAAFWFLSAVVLWRGLPSRFRAVVPLVAMSSIYVGNAVGGTTDSLYLPFLLVALWRWDRFGEPLERSPARWAGPLALGVACAFKQAAWFVVPFLVVAIGVEAEMAGRSWRRAVVKYCGLAAFAFLVPNLPFIIWNPVAWMSSTTLPLVAPLVPYGQGLVALSLYLQRGGGDLSLYTFAAAGVLVTLCLALAVTYPRLKRALPVLPAVALLFPTRSLDTYFLYVVPGLLMGAATVGPVRQRLRRHRHSHRGRAGWVLCGLGACVSIGFALGAISDPPPIGLTILGEHSTGQLQTVDQLTVAAVNRTGSDLRPHFAVTLGPFMGSYWFVASGPTVLGPRVSARYVLDAPNVASMPGIATGFELYAMTIEPAAVSWSAPLQPDPDRTQITPQAIDYVVTNPAGTTLSVQVVDRLNQPVRRAGITVALSQVLYTQDGLFPGETSINGHAEGQSPVTAVTNASGVARFDVREVQLQPYEVFYQAYIAGPFPHGYSYIVSVRFGSA